MRYGLVVVLAAVAFVASGCSTTVALKYEAPKTQLVKVEPAALVTVGTFDDKRGEEANYLGTIRGGYGNPLKRVYSSAPVSESVAAAFADGLRARGAYADAESAKYVLAGTITNLDCTLYMNYGAVARIDIILTERASGKRVFSDTFSKESKVASIGPGVFGSGSGLGELCRKNVCELVDMALDDPTLRAAMK
jgi:hypothetical protein